MRDYKVNISVEVKFDVEILTKAEDMFTAEAKVEKIIRDVILNSINIKVLVSFDKSKINILLFRMFRFNEGRTLI